MPVYGPQPNSIRDILSFLGRAGQTVAKKAVPFYYGIEPLTPEEEKERVEFVNQKLRELGYDPASLGEETAGDIPNLKRYSPPPATRAALTAETQFAAPGVRANLESAGRLTRDILGATAKTYTSPEGAISPFATFGKEYEELSRGKKTAGEKVGPARAKAGATLLGVAAAFADMGGMGAGKKKTLEAALKEYQLYRESARIAAERGDKMIRVGIKRFTFREVEETLKKLSDDIFGMLGKEPPKEGAARAASPKTGGALQTWEQEIFGARPGKPQAGFAPPSSAPPPPGLPPGAPPPGRIPGPTSPKPPEPPLSFGEKVKDFLDRPFGATPYDADYDPTLSHLGPQWAKVREKVVNPLRRALQPQVVGEISANRSVHELFGKLERGHLASYFTGQDLLKTVKSRGEDELLYAASHDPEAAARLQALANQRPKDYAGLLTELVGWRDISARTGEEGLRVGAVRGLLDNYIPRRVTGPPEEVARLREHIRAMRKEAGKFQRGISGPKSSPHGISRTLETQEEFDNLITEAIETLGLKKTRLDKSFVRATTSYLRSMSDAISGRRFADNLRASLFTEGPDAGKPFVITKEMYQADPVRYREYLSLRGDRTEHLRNWFAVQVSPGQIEVGKPIVAPTWQTPDEVFLHPRIHRAIEPILEYTRYLEGDPLHRLQQLMGYVKRFKMYNVFVHGNHQVNNLLVGPGSPLDPTGFTKAIRGLYEGNDLLARSGLTKFPMKDLPVDEEVRKGVLYAVEHGFNVRGHEELGKEIFDAVEKMDPGATTGISLQDKLGKIVKSHDDVLWKNIVAAGAYKLWNDYYSIFLKKGFDPDRAAWMASNQANSLSGLLKKETMSHGNRLWGNLALFARNWTYSNLRIYRGGAGLFGHTPIFNPAERRALGYENQKIMARGIYYMTALPNMANMWVTGHPMWENPEGMKTKVAVWKDVDERTGEEEVYYVGLQPWMRDVIHYSGVGLAIKGEPTPLETFGHKLNPFPLGIYKIATNTRTFPEGAPLARPEVVGVNPDGTPKIGQGRLSAIKEVAGEVFLPTDIGMEKVRSIPAFPGKAEIHLSPWQQKVLGKLRDGSYLKRYLSRTTPIPPVPLLPFYGGPPAAAWTFGFFPGKFGQRAEHAQARGRVADTREAVYRMLMKREKEKEPPRPYSLKAIGKETAVEGQPRKKTPDERLREYGYIK